MKLGLFSDSHYSSQEVTCGCRYNSCSLEKMRRAYRAFEVAGCDLVICLGDLTDREDCHEKELANLRAAAEVIQSAAVPTVCVMGNHDAFSFTVEEFYGVLDRCCPKPRTVEGKTLLFADACYFKSGRHYAPGDEDWTDTCLPDTDSLEKSLEEAEGEVLFFLHQNVDPHAEMHHCLANAAAVRAILENSGKVKAVYQGHYHPGLRSTHNGIDYVTLPAMCEGDDRWEIIEI